MRSLLHPLRFRRDHRFTQAHASDYIDGALDEADQRRVHEHSGLCPPCRRLLDSLRRTLSELRAMSDPAPPSVADGVIARLRDKP